MKAKVIIAIITICGETAKRCRKIADKAMDWAFNDKGIFEDSINYIEYAIIAETYCTYYEEATEIEE